LEAASSALEGSMDISVEKIPGGFRVDGLDLKNGKCGCTSVLPCCYSWSKVKRSGETFTFSGKASGPDSVETFTWGYTVKKGSVSIEVFMEDARDKRIFTGYYPPALEAWVERGWEVLSKSCEWEDFDLWRCATCKWLYKEGEQGVKFEDLPEDWKCPICKAGKNAFEKVG
jgi:rubredoxin